MKPSDIKEKTMSELSKLRGELEEEVWRLKFRKSSGQLKQTANIRKTRKDLARVRTFLRAMDLKKEAI